MAGQRTYMKIIVPLLYKFFLGVIGMFIACILSGTLILMFNLLPVTIGIVSGPISEEISRYYFCKKRLNIAYISAFAVGWWFCEVWVKASICSHPTQCVYYWPLGLLAHFIFTLTYLDRVKLRYPILISLLLHMAANYYSFFGFHYPHHVWEQNYVWH
jgi:hypothetical protein